MTLKPDLQKLHSSNLLMINYRPHKLKVNSASCRCHISISTAKLHIMVSVSLTVRSSLVNKDGLFPNCSKWGYSTSLTAVTFGILPDNIEWIILRESFANYFDRCLVVVCTTPSWFTRPFFLCEDSLTSQLYPTLTLVLCILANQRIHYLLYRSLFFVGVRGESG